ncbi:phage tail tape measure protein [Methylomonas sp. SURF-2]|uniref:Phage tail tape measure protein n=1 Tax=Methylomonas subterranea TaxID=2952225 RepID=A0ABT1TCQ6_9GAMM|nr:phage tail tape measure protein [Methylomonas sp. SURF-2]MCQ8103243.1 phage tail tape measure protein [Methylomonas sp. SURF-2]
MSAAATAELRLKFKDVGATSGIDKVAKRIEQQTKQTENLVNQSNNRQRSSYERLSHAREQLGMRSEKRIQLEISRTESAYKRLAASGKLSQDELTRAAEKTRQKITRLTNEMGKLTKEQQAAAKAAKQFETAQNRIRTGVAVGAGIAAAGYTLKAPVMNAMSFDERIAYLSNTANNELDVRGRKAGKAELEKAVNDSIKFGGTRENSLSALELLASSNAFTTQDAIKLLPQVIKTSTATNTSAADVVQVGLAAMQNMGVAPENLPAVFNMAAAGGQAGKFEFTDQAKFLPSQLAAAQGLGFSGTKGLASIVALNQAAVTTAGNSNEAGINVENLLSKINSEDTRGKIDKVLKVNSASYFEKRLKQGVNTLDAFGELVDKNVSRRSDYRDLQKQLKSSKSDSERKAVLESMTKIAESAGIGEIINDRQALMAFLGYRNNPELMAKVLAKINANNVNSGGEVDKSFSVISDTAGFKVREAEQQAAIAQKNAMDVLTPTIGKVAQGFSDLSQRYPDLSAAVVGATPPVIAFGSAVGVTTLALGGARGGAGLSAAAIAASSGISKFGAALAAIVGWNIGKDFGDNTVKPWIDEQVQNLTGDKNTTLGSSAYDLVESAKNLVHVIIEPKDMGYVARVDKQKSSGVASTEIRGSNTGNWRTGAPGSP